MDRRQLLAGLFGSAALPALPSGKVNVVAPAISGAAVDGELLAVHGNAFSPYGGWELRPYQRDALAYMRRNRWAPNPVDSLISVEDWLVEPTPAVRLAG